MAERSLELLPVQDAVGGVVLEHLHHVCGGGLAEVRQTTDLIKRRQRRRGCRGRCWRCRRLRRWRRCVDGLALLLEPTTELVEGQPAVAVRVGLAETLPRSDGGQVLRWGLQGLPQLLWVGVVHDLVHRRQVRRHLVQADVAVAIHVEHVERRAHLLVHVVAAQHRQATRQLAEVHHAVGVAVEQREQPRREQGRPRQRIRRLVAQQRAERRVERRAVQLAVLVGERGEQRHDVRRTAVAQRRRLLDGCQAVAVAKACTHTRTVAVNSRSATAGGWCRLAEHWRGGEPPLELILGHDVVVVGVGGSEARLGELRARLIGTDGGRHAQPLASRWRASELHAQQGGHKQAHFVQAQHAVAVDVEQREGGVDALGSRGRRAALATHHRQAGAQLRKVDQPVAVAIKGVEQLHAGVGVAAGRRLAGRQQRREGAHEGLERQQALAVCHRGEGIQHLHHRLACNRRSQQCPHALWGCRALAGRPVAGAAWQRERTEVGEGQAALVVQAALLGGGGEAAGRGKARQLVWGHRVATCSGGDQRTQHSEHRPQVQLHLVLRDVPLAGDVEEVERRTNAVGRGAAAQHRQTGREHGEVEGAAVAVVVQALEQAARQGLAKGGVTWCGRGVGGRHQVLVGGVECGAGHEALAVGVHGEQVQHLGHRVDTQRRVTLYVLQVQRGASASASTGHARRHLHQQPPDGRVAALAEVLLELLAAEAAVVVGVGELEALTRGVGGQLLCRLADLGLQVGLGGVQHAEHTSEVRLHLAEAHVAIAVGVI